MIQLWCGTRSCSGNVIGDSIEEACEVASSRGWQQDKWGWRCKPCLSKRQIGAQLDELVNAWFPQSEPPERHDTDPAPPPVHEEENG